MVAGGGPLRCYGGAVAGGSQGPSVNSRVRASRAPVPHLAVVDRQDWTIAKSARPGRVRQVPPEVRCWTLTGRTFPDRGFVACLTGLGGTAPRLDPERDLRRRVRVPEPPEVPHVPGLLRLGCLCYIHFCGAEHLEDRIRPVGGGKPPCCRRDRANRTRLLAPPRPAAVHLPFLKPSPRRLDRYQCVQRVVAGMRSHRRHAGNEQFGHPHDMPLNRQRIPPGGPVQALRTPRWSFKRLHILLRIQRTAASISSNTSGVYRRPWRSRAGTLPMPRG